MINHLSLLDAQEPTMHTNSSTVQDAHAINEALADAIASAGYAPSIHNTQPWRWWCLDDDTVNLYLERSRVRSVTDPDLRQAILSCGAALHHVRTTLAAEGWRAAVTRMPDPADQDHFAHVRVEQSAPPDRAAVRHVRTIALRHTNRRPVTGAPVGREDLRAITTSVQAEGAWLHLLRPDQVPELAAAAGQAQHTDEGQPEWLAELAYWTDAAVLARTTIPYAVAQHSPPTTVAGHDADDPPISARRDRSALFAILYGRSDEPRDWLRAGEALSAGWLTATERGISVLPLSAPVEVPAARDTMRRFLSYLNHPFLVLRLGTVDAADADAPHTPRLPTDQIIQRA
jgi:nitroreductase